MRLTRLELSGFRRFVRSQVDLDDDVVALIGPNEAGKSSILAALEFVGTDEPIPLGDLSRSCPAEAGPVVTALFLLETSDRNLLRAEYADQEPPRWLKVEKPSAGPRKFAVLPAAKRSRGVRQAIANVLNEPQFAERLSTVLSGVGAKPNPAVGSLMGWVTVALAGLAADSESLPEEALRALQELQAVTKDIPGEKLRLAGENFRELLSEAIRRETESHPSERASALMSKRLPPILMFREQDRILKTEYSMAEALSPRGALANLFGAVGLPLLRVKEALASKDPTKRLWLQEHANRNLRKRLSKAWTQMGVDLTLQIDSDVVRVLVASEDDYSLLSERSEGLRLFVALWAFLEGKRATEKPVLLLDEAESHLHYDAQLDLVRMMEHQNEAQQVIYSTHSAACLPSDLGRGVRAVRPESDGRRDGGTSTILSSLWLGEGGFSPLLTAMGASALALLPTRFAVICEGAADIILLPSLLRAAVGRKLLYQLAPGIASVDKSGVAALELEAPRLVYLVDGDEGASRHATKLRSAGIEDSRIISMDPGKCPEDFVGLEVYLEVVNEQLRRSFGEALLISREQLTAVGRPGAVARICREANREPPSKVRIAVGLAQRARGEGFLDSEAQQVLSALNERIEHALGFASRVARSR